MTGRLSAAIAGLLLASAAVCAGAAEPVTPLPMAELAPGLYVHAGRQEDWLPTNAGDVANLGFIVGTRCVAVIDTGGSPEIGRRLRASVAAATRLPVCYVILTHAHPDHVLGGSAFVGDGTRAGTGPGTGPRVVAHARLPAALSAREPYYLNAMKRDFGQTLLHEDIVYPELTVTGTLELDLGDRTLVLRAWPTAHTDNDLTVFDSRTRTLFLGDLLFAGHLPVVDGSLRGWLKSMDELRRMDVALAIPGHGAPSTRWPAALDPQQRYLDKLLQETRAAIKNRIDLRQAVEASKPDAPASWLLMDLFHKRNVTAAYAELEWEE